MALVCIVLVLACGLIWLACAFRHRKAHNAFVERVRRLESGVFSRTIPDRKLMEAFKDSVPDDPQPVRHKTRKLNNWLYGSVAFFVVRWRIGAAPSGKPEENI